MPPRGKVASYRFFSPLTGCRVLLGGAACSNFRSVDGAVAADGRKERGEDFAAERDDFSFGNRGGAERDAEAGDEKAGQGNAVGAGAPAAMPPTSVMTRLILIMVWRKLIRNPNTYSSLIGLIWSLVCFR